MNQKKITLDTERKSFESIIAMQGDNKSRYIDATIVNRSIPLDLTGCTVKFSAIKPDITDIFNDAVISDAKGGKVKIELTNQTLAVPGVIQATLVILKEDMQLSVLPFFITVIENPYNPNAIESKSEYKALNNALTVVDGYAKELQDASVNLEEKYTTRLNNFGSQLDNSTQYLKSGNYTYTNFGKAFQGGSRHVSWAYSNVHFDKKINKVVCFYVEKPQHHVINCKLLMRHKDVYGDFTESKVIADKLSKGISCRSQASAILNNGDYLVLVSEINNDSSNYESLRTMVYKSSDSGKTWSTHEMLLDGQAVKGYDGDVCGVLVLKSGRIITHISTADTNRTCKIVYSDNNGLTWTQANWLGNPTMHTEPAWCELSDGTIVAYFRKDVGTIVQEPIPAIFTKSTDGGLTWSSPTNSKSILDFTQSNGNMVYCEESKSVEFIHHSRRSRDDGYTSIYVARAFEDDVKNDNFGEQIRIGRLNYCGLQSNGTYGDGGYIGACRDKDKNIFVMYYNGSKTSANLCYLMGKKDGVFNRSYEINEKDGTKITNNSLNRVVNLYNRGNEYTDITGGWQNGINLVYGSIDKLSDRFRLHATGTVSRKGICTVKKIDVTDIQYIYATISTIVHEGEADSGASISLFTKQSPTNSTDGRVIHCSVSQLGNGLIKCDVSNISGEYYIHIVANTNNDSSTCLFNCYEVWGESSSNLVEVDKVAKLYSEVNEVTSSILPIYKQGKIYERNGYKISKYFDVGTGNVETLSDSLFIEMSGSGASRKGFMLNNILDSTGKHYIIVDFEILNKTGTNRFEVTLFNKNNPTTENDGVIKKVYYENNGKYRVNIPIGNLNQTFYLGLLTSMGSANSGTIKVYIDTILIQ